MSENTTSYTCVDCLSQSDVSLADHKNPNIYIECGCGERCAPSDSDEIKALNLKQRNGMKTRSVSVSMDGTRKSITSDLEELGQFLKELIENHDIQPGDAEDVIRLFDQAACGVNCLNCIHSAEDDLFNPLDDLEVSLLGDYDNQE